MSTYLKNMAGYKHNQLKNKSFNDIQKLFDKAIKRVNTFVDMDTELVEGSEQKLEKDKEIAELQRLIEVVPDKEEVVINAIHLETKPPSIVDYKIHKEGNKTYYQIIRADGSSKMYLVFSHMLKSFDREDLETLCKLVKAKHGSIRPKDGYERVLWGDLKTMFDPHVEDQGTRERALLLSMHYGWLTLEETYKDGTNSSNMGLKGMWDRRVSIGQTLNENSSMSILEPLMGLIIERGAGNYNRSTSNEMFSTDDEDPHEHVRRVLEIADLFHFHGVTHDAVMLRVFPITLKGPALRWINRLLAGLVTTWDLLEKAFIRQYCPPFKTAKKLEIIRNFKQEMDETLYHAWERYNDLLFKCPQHDLNCQQKVHIFYTGLDIPTRNVLDSKGFIHLMTPTQALISIQVMA
ncbi:reverse transcriptase domain-containing protein [Tanacetum coccineum]